MAQRKKRGAARKPTPKRGRAPKRPTRTKAAERVAAKTAPKKRVTKAKARRAVAKKSATKAPGPPPQSDAAAETVIVDVIEEPVPDVTVVTEFEATRVQGSEVE
jgi:fructose-1,6-bisphosphatase/inositol monophosphatase family enzyme